MALINKVRIADALDTDEVTVTAVVWEAEDDVTGQILTFYFAVGTSDADAQAQMSDADTAEKPPPEQIKTEEPTWQLDPVTGRYCARDDTGRKLFDLEFIGGNATFTMFDTAGNPVIIPSCRLFATDQQSIPNAAWTSINWPDENYDALGMHDIVTNNTRITIPTGADGKYLVTAAAGFSANNSGNRGLRILKNGVEGEGQRSFVPNAGAGNFTTPAVSDVLDLVGGDYLEIAAWQNSGGALALVGVDADYNHFAAIKLD